MRSQLQTPSKIFCLWLLTLLNSSKLVNFFDILMDKVRSDIFKRGKAGAVGGAGKLYFYAIGLFRIVPAEKSGFSLVQ
ncbi:unnamed protein product [Calypogeia fissa]